MRTRRAYVDLIWNGAAVSGKMSGYQKDVTYTDPASGEADSIDVSIFGRFQPWTIPPAWCGWCITKRTTT